MMVSNDPEPMADQMWSPVTVCGSPRADGRPIVVYLALPSPPAHPPKEVPLRQRTRDASR
jgi:hypothetical protein